MCSLYRDVHDSVTHSAGAVVSAVLKDTPLNAAQYSNLLIGVFNIVSLIHVEKSKMQVEILRNNVNLDHCLGNFLPLTSLNVPQ